MRTRMVVIGALVGAIGVTGCGGGGTKEGPATTAVKTADRVQQAASKGDGKKLCDDVFSPSLKSFIARRSGKSCDQAVKGKLITDLSSVRVFGLTLNAAATRGELALIDKAGANDRLFVVRSGNDWKVNAILKPGLGRLGTSG